MAPQSALSQTQEERLQEILAAYLRDVEAGRNPDQAEILSRHPDLAGELQDFFAGQEQLGRLAAPLRQVVEPDAGAGITGTLGDFRIVREVGRGGMGIVYEAEQISLRRRVALKVLPFAATMDPRHLQRFHNEAQAAACLHHTNIVPVHFVGSERGVHFYAMQFIDGQPLSEIIRQLRRVEQKTPGAGEVHTVAYHPGADDAASTPLPAAELTPLTGEGRRSRDYFRKVAELGVQAAEALDHAHQLGIVHRDIKPANLLLDGRGILWVTDFGLAHVQHGEASLTGTGQMVGTPRYMSPEQALAKRVPIDHRTDVYSLGVTLYELLTLRTAFASEDRQELLRQIAFEEPPRPRRLERGIPAELEIIVLKAMEKRPQDRYATAQELADDLERWLRHESIRARRPSWVQMARKWTRRHQAVVWSVAVCALFIVAVGGANIGWIAARRANSAESFGQAVQQAIDFMQKEKWPEAKAAAQHAAGLLAGAGGDSEQHQRLEQLESDLNMARELELIRLQKTEVKDGHFDDESADPAYAAAFRNYNFPVLELDPEEAIQRIASSIIREQLLTALMDWANVRTVQAGKKKLAALVRLADGDPWRRQIMDAQDHQDRAELARLVQMAEALDLPPARLGPLGNLLAQFDKPAAVRFLRQAQQRHPDDFWINHHLAFSLMKMEPPQLEEAIGFYRAVVALRPQSPGVHQNLGVALAKKGRLDEAIAEFRDAIQLKMDYAEAHCNLGQALEMRGHVDKAIAEFRECIRLKKDDAFAHFKLGYNLNSKGQLDEAIGEYREAIRLKRDYALAHNNLGIALEAKGQVDEAIAEYRKAIRINKDYPEAHYNLSNTLRDRGLLDEAIAECREAIRLKNNSPEAHHNLGYALHRKGRLDEAIAEYREAIRLKKDFASAHVNLKNALAMRDISAKLPAILSGKAKADNPAQQIALAWFCQQPYKRLYAAAAKFYGDAFAAQPRLADDLSAQHRYNAACATALASCSQGKDADKLDTKERARLRQQALDWLRADLKVYQRDMEKVPDKAGPTIAQRMQHWLQDGDFACVRGDEALAKLPEEERSAWRKLWADVAELLAKAQGKTPAEKKSDTKSQPRDHTGA